MGVHWGIVAGVADTFVVLLTFFRLHVVFLREYDVSRLLHSHHDNGKTHIERRQ